MELSREQCNEQNKAQLQSAIFDFVGEQLAITLEKHNVEVLIDASRIPQDMPGSDEFPEVFRAIIECEDVLETENILEITLSGAIQKKDGVLETFMLFFSLTWDFTLYSSKERMKKKDVCTNHLWLQFGHKKEQFSDIMYHANLYRKELSGRQFELARGFGFLVFEKNRSGYTH